MTIARYVFIGGAIWLVVGFLATRGFGAVIKDGDRRDDADLIVAEAMRILNEHQASAGRLPVTDLDEIECGWTAAHATDDPIVIAWRLIAANHGATFLWPEPCETQR